MSWAIGIGLALAAALAYALVTAWRRAMHDGAPLPFFGMIVRRRPAPTGPDSEVGAKLLALAARRCAFCGDKEQCRAWLASGRQDGYPAYCPNADLFDKGNADRAAARSASAG